MWFLGFTSGQGARQNPGLRIEAALPGMHAWVDDQRENAMRTMGLVGDRRPSKLAAELARVATANRLTPNRNATDLSADAAMAVPLAGAT